MGKNEKTPITIDNVQYQYEQPIVTGKGVEIGRAHV